jgi:hypothetical protein
MAKNAQIESGAGGGFPDARTGSYGEGERRDKVRKYVDSRNNQRVQPMIRSQLAAMQHGIPCWIYNVSPIFEWRRQYKGLGTFTISRRPSVGQVILLDGKEHTVTESDILGRLRVSQPLLIEHAYRQSYDKGDNRRIPYVEYGEEIAESLVGNSKLYPPDLLHPTNNLENWGVFITYGTTFHELPKAQQDELFLRASALHQKRCYEKVQIADRHINRFPQTVLEMHRQCALFVGEKRPWVTERTIQAKIDVMPCPFCASEIKASVVKCPQCREIVNFERYEAMKARKGDD